MNVYKVTVWSGETLEVQADSAEDARRRVEYETGQIVDSVEDYA